MQEQNKENQSQASLDNEIKQVPYFPASEDCKDLGAVVPKNFAFEQKNFNSILKANFDVSKFVMNRLGYKSVEALCSAFAKEQIDAIATAIYNFERNGFGLIVSDQTGLGKGRVVAGLIRYTIHHLEKVPVFWTEKKTLFSDIYRDLIDIKFDAGVPIKKKTKSEVDGDSLTEKQVIKIIKADIKDADELRIDYDFEEDFKLKDLFKEENFDILEDVIERYREFITSNGLQSEAEYEKVSDKKYKDDLDVALANGRTLITPFSTFPVKIQDKEGNVLYEVKSKDLKDAFRNQELSSNVKLVMMTYSQIRRTLNDRGELTPKFRLIQKMCNDAILILDESHNAAGNSATFRTMTNLLLSAKDVVYVSATWAKRPDNMPLYALRTSIKESFLNPTQLANAFQNGGLSLQEVTSSVLVSTGQLVRRERTFKGETDYYYANPDSDIPEEKEIGLNQINKINRIAEAIYKLQEFESIARENLKLVLEKYVDDDEKKLYKYSGVIQRNRFLLFNYFLLGIKIKQATKEALSQLKSGRKVIIAIANTLESAFSNIKQDYYENIPYQLGDNVKNDFSLILKYLLYNSIAFKKRNITINDAGEAEEETITYRPLEFNEEQKRITDGDFGIANEWFDIIQGFIEENSQDLDLELGIPLSPIDQIKHIIKQDGFVIEEITGRSKCLQFENDEYNTANLNYGVLSKREKMAEDRDVINMFNFNQIDALIINQSGATGVSMHAVPTTDKEGKIILPVNVVPTNPPTSLIPKNEVKQRCMIIMQMELDINKEIQKLGRVERSGQVFPPIYKYIFSAIPSEARLAAMMQRKLKSLMANTKGGSEQGKELFNADDLFSPFAVKPWNDTCDILGLGRLYWVANQEEIYKKTSLFYFLDYKRQRDFFALLVKNLNEHIAYLKTKGLYFGEVQFKDYNSKTSDIIPFILGDNYSLTEFGGHTYAERVEVTEYDERNLESNITQYVNDNLSINKDGETYVYNSLEEYQTAMKKSINEMVEEYINVLQGRNADNQNLIESYEQDKKAVEDNLSNYPNLEEVLSIREKIDSLEIKKEENKKQIADLLEDSSEDNLKKANILTRENQQIITQRNQLVEKENQLLGSIESITDLKRLYNQANSQIKNLNDSINTEKNRIQRRNNDIQKQEKYKLFILQKIAEINQIFDITNYAEQIEYTEDEFGNQSSIFVYTESEKTKAVLVGVKFNFNANDHFIPSQIELRFAKVTKTENYTANYIFDDFNNDEKERNKKPMVELFNTNIGYEKNWDSYVASIYTGYQIEKVFLSGNLLRGLAFNYLIGLTGNIVKYNTIDSKLRTSIVLNQSSSDQILPRFNEGINYTILMDLTKDNFERNFCRGIAATSIRNKKLASQLLYDTQRSFLIVAANRNLQESIMQKFENYLVDNNMSRWKSYDDEELLNLITEIVRNNTNDILVTFSSQRQDLIKTIDSIVSNLGSQSTDDLDEFEGMDSPKHQVKAMSYTDKGKIKKPKITGDNFISPIAYTTIREKTFDRDSTELLGDVFIMEANMIVERASKGTEFFLPIWNITMSYDIFLRLIEFLQARYVRMLTTTSKQLVDLATPAYSFNFGASAMGTIDTNGTQVIEGIAENTIETIEDVLQQFIEYYQA